MRALALPELIDTGNYNTLDQASMKNARKPHDSHLTQDITTLQ